MPCNGNGLASRYGPILLMRPLYCCRWWRRLSKLGPKPLRAPGWCSWSLCGPTLGGGKLHQTPWQLVTTYSRETPLFLDHRGVTLPPTRWPAQVYQLAPSADVAALHSINISYPQLCTMVSPTATELPKLLQAA